MTREELFLRISIDPRICFGEPCIRNDWKPMPSVGLGVQEIRIHTGTEHRVLYVAKFAEAVYILHAFEKRTRRTAKDDLDVARHRMQLLLNQRARRTG